MHEQTRTALNTLDSKGRVFVERDDKSYLDLCRVGGKYRIELYNSRDTFGVWTYSGTSLRSVIRVLDNHFQRIEATQ